MKASSGRRAWDCLLLVLLAVVLPAFGCKKKGPDTFVYSVFVDEAVAMAESLEIDGKPIALTKQQRGGKTFDVTLPAAELLVEKKASVVMVTTCGPSKLTGKLTVGITHADRRDGEEYERRLLEKGKNDFTASFVLAAPLRLADVYVDDDDGATAPVMVGTMTVDPKAHPQRVPLGTCPTGDDVKVGDALAEKLAVAPRHLHGKPAPGTAFVDAKGGHCYEKQLHIYVDTDANSKMAREAPVRLEGKRVYALDIDDFLVPSPKTVNLKDDDLPFRTEIRRCAAAPAAPIKSAPPRAKSKR